MPTAMIVGALCALVGAVLGLVVGVKLGWAACSWDMLRKLEAEAPIFTAER